MPNSMQICWLFRRCMTNSVLDLHQNLHSTTQMLHVGVLAGTLLAAGCCSGAAVGFPLFLSSWLAVWRAGCLAVWLAVCLAVWPAGCRPGWLCGCLDVWLAAAAKGPMMAGGMDGWLSPCKVAIARRGVTAPVHCAPAPGDSLGTQDQYSHLCNFSFSHDFCIGWYRCDSHPRPFVRACLFNDPGCNPELFNQNHPSS